MREKSTIAFKLNGLKPAVEIAHLLEGLRGLFTLSSERRGE
jgi:hypothetical protein